MVSQKIITMKKISTLVLSVLTLSSIAQPTLTGNNAPTVGTSYSVKSADTVGIMPGASGANKTWNFDLTFTSSPETASFIDASGTPYASSFPSANLAFESTYGSTTSYTYYVTNANEYSLVGSKSNDGYTETFSNTEVLTHFPFNFNDTYQDDYESTFTSTWGNGNFSGSATQTYDAYGTLTINGVTYDNVARIKEVSEYAGSYSGQSYTGGYEAYSWYPSNGRIPVLSISTGSYSYGSDDYYYKSVTLAEEEALSSNDVKDAEFDFAITSLIAQGQNANATVNAPANEINVEVYDVVGRCISKQQFDSTMSIEIETAQLAKGMYLVQVQAGNAVATKKITIQ
jgi:hypothetical protein